MPATFIPRALSPLHFEPLQADPDDVLCPGSDVEEAWDQHLAKKRRVEEAGRQYLKGKTLYIASARLKGPFTALSSTLFGTTGASEAKAPHPSDHLRHPTRNPRPALAPRLRASPTAMIIDPEPEVIIVSSHESTTQGTMDADALSRDHGYTQDSFVTADSKTVKEPRRLDRNRDNDLAPQDWLKTRDISHGKRKFRVTDRSATPTPSSRPRANSPKRRSRLSPRVAGARPEVEKYQPESHAKKPKTTDGPTLNQLHPDQGQVRDVLSKDRKSHHRSRQLSPQVLERVSHMQRSRPENPVTFRKPRVQSKERYESTVDPDMHVQGFESGAHALPPSTNLQAFEYRYASARNSRSPQRMSFEEDLEAAKEEAKEAAKKEEAKAAAKKKARVEERRRLSFTASGSVKHHSHGTSSRESWTPQSSRAGSSSKISQPRSTEQQSLPQTKHPSDEDAVTEDQRKISGQAGDYPEAQVRQGPAFIKVPSGLSTGLLETDKLSSNLLSADEGDSYIGLSTQAALFKAQRSIYDQIVSPLFGGNKSSSSSAFEDAGNVDEERNVVPDGRITASPQPEPATPSSASEEPMSTQAMIDGLSPFVDTTIKKRRSINRRPRLTPSKSSESSSPTSPTAQDYRTKSLSMSTTPSPPPPVSNDAPPVPLSALSKPASTFTSFSFAPAGTMSEVFHQDGQRPQGYVMDEVDLDAAIEEAGSFLGDWNVEREARNQERSTAESKASTGNGSRTLSSH
ncbi:MAG: hypothetical protein LQ350_000216 [Teloschistes chrysophthalmus]|nr:MAG: hypothetical protein LQ350_000216 [Niorma chrysophthalma]